ncbi:MAG: DegT/DnrJ/EryC1/StrS aminotransferase family protein, partial [Myxococcales bacterium]|nr:DegT/DnrJ/EryC1/StrS aminotransferase family protein [Myxococcales bacterium]
MSVADGPFADALGAFTGLEHVVPVGRASLGIAAVLLAFRGQGTLKVAVSAAVCQDVIAAVLLAGASPLLCDVELETGLVPSSEWIRARAAGARAAIVVHLYGNAAETSEVRRIFAAPDCLVLDDAAQALGARSSTGLAGAEGDVGIYSFGPTKHIEVGGGALCFSDAGLAAESRVALASLGVSPTSEVEAAQQRFRSGLNLARETLRAGPQTEIRPFAGLLTGYEAALRVEWRPEWGPLIARALRAFPEALERRRETAEAWGEIALAAGLVPVGMGLSPATRSVCAPWRFACRLPGADWASQHVVGERLRSTGLNVSHWYLPGH